MRITALGLLVERGYKGGGRTHGTSPKAATADGSDRIPREIVSAIMTDLLVLSNLERKTNAFRIPWMKVSYTLPAYTQ